jgi:two-component sensor histidine kinase
VRRHSMLWSRGPDIVLAADAAQPVAFVFHELVTNAAKYGALSIPKGHVSVQWHQRANGHVPEALVLDWKETGGPRIPASISPGYGTSVVKDLIPYELGGVACAVGRKSKAPAVAFNCDRA